MASENKPIGGTVNFRAGGNRYSVAGEATYKVNGVIRETQVGMDGVHGFVQKYKQGQIKVKLRDLGDLSLAEINSWGDVDVSLDLANGKGVVGTKMWVVDDQEIKIEDGTVDVVFEGKTVYEVKANA